MSRKLESRAEVMRAFGLDIGLLTQAVVLSNVDCWSVEGNVVRANLKQSDLKFDMGVSITGNSGKVLEITRPGILDTASLVNDVAKVDDLARKAVELRLVQLISGDRALAGKTRFTLRYKENDAAAEMAAIYNATHPDTTLTHSVPKESLLAMPGDVLVDSGMPESTITRPMFETVAGNQSTVISAAGRRNLTDYMLGRLDKATWGAVNGGYTEVALRTRLQNGFDPEQVAASFRQAFMGSSRHWDALMDANVRAIGVGTCFNQGVFALHMTLDQMKNSRAINTQSIRLYRAFFPIVSN